MVEIYIPSHTVGFKQLYQYYPTVGLTIGWDEKQISRFSSYIMYSCSSTAYLRPKGFQMKTTNIPILFI